MWEPLQLEYLFADRPYAPALAPAGYDTLCLESGGSEIYGAILWPDGGFTGKRPCVIVSHGYPGVARNDDLAFALRRIGCVVVVVHHRGAWGSRGKYLISHCVEDVETLCAFVRSEDFCRRYHTDPEALFLLGHSMGGNSVLQAARHVPPVRGLILLAPYDPTRLLRDGNPEPLMELLRECRIMNSDGPEAILADIRAHLAEYPFERAGRQLRERNVCCIVGSLDTIVPWEMVRPLWEELTAGAPGPVRRLVELPATHGFCGNRIAVTETAARFVCDVCGRM